MEETKDDFVDRYVEASRKMADMLDYDARMEWYSQRILFHDAKERGDNYVMTPLARALDLAVYEHCKDGAELVFPPGAVILYRRALKANQN
jgi:hypothetical protein